ncbi:MAG: C45 family autoproteolytic acyltransferase/hydrolase [Methanothrix sp.]|nr:C45 family autoproteolytic acyltransferase/hydrolase [Methanothrix sp.]
MQLSLVILVYSLIIPCMAQAMEDNSSPVLLSQYEGGKLYGIDKLLVLQLSGSYREMGRQEGYLLKDQIHDYYNCSVLDYFIKDNNMSYERLALDSMDRFNHYPKRFRDILSGISETSGLSLLNLTILSRVPYIAPGCSAAFAWSEYSRDAYTVAGRNLDFYSTMEDFINYTIVCIYNPTDGSHSVASVCRLTQLEIHTGMNDQGIFLEANDGSSSGGTTFFPDRITYLGSFLFDFSSLEQLDAAIHSSQINWATLLNVADEREARSYEWATFDLKRAMPMRDGFLASTNHFSNPDWGLGPLAGDPYNTTLRRDNLLRLGERYRGEFDAEAMMNVLDTDIEKGGPSGNFTRLKVVAIPRENELWVKIPKYQNWTRVDLNEFFIGPGAI